MIPKFEGYAFSGLMTMIGGFGQYLWYLSKGRQFRWSSFFITLGLAFVLGMMLGAILPPDMPMRDGVMMTSGFSVYGVLKMVEERMPDIMSRVLSGLVGGTPKPPDRV